MEFDGRRAKGARMEKAYLFAAFWPGSAPLRAPSLEAGTLPGAEFWISSMITDAVCVLVKVKLELNGRYQKANSIGGEFGCCRKLELAGMWVVNNEPKNSKSGEMLRCVCNLRRAKRKRGVNI